MAATENTREIIIDKINIRTDLWDLETVFLYSPNNFIARINEYQFQAIRVQIKEQKLEGYYVISDKNEEPLYIDKDGRLENWGSNPIFSTIDNLLLKLL